MGLFESVASMGSSLFNLGGSYLLAENADSNARSREGDNMMWNLQAYKQRYQNTVADMRAAGLNPILAATGGFSVGNAPQVAQVSATPGSWTPSQSFSSTAKDYAEIAKAEAEVDKIREETTNLGTIRAKIEEETRKIGTEITNLEAQTRSLDQGTLESMARESREKAATGKISAETATEMERLKNVATDTFLKVQEAKRVVADIRQINSNINRQEAETTLAGQRTRESMAMQRQINETTKEVIQKTYNLNELRRGITANADSAEAIAKKLKQTNQFYEGIPGAVLGAVRAAADAIGLHSTMPFKVQE